MRAKAEYFGRLSLQVLLVAFCFLSAALPNTSRAKDMPVVAEWHRFEHAFKSSSAYSNPLGAATLNVAFTSPSGETRTVNGFWDGGKTWRVRFAPNEIGRWTFRSTCSDAANKGLHEQTGEFTCTVPSGSSRFEQHGPVLVARDHRRFEHADGTPFFWLADTVWNGARVSESKDWEYYARTRAAQQFTVSAWAVAPGPDLKGEKALGRRQEVVEINPTVFQRLDAKLELLSRAGILSAVAPLLELETEQKAAAALTDEQAAVFVRYVTARWAAEPVVWMLAFEGDAQTKIVGRWKHIGQVAFTNAAHAPVLLYPGSTPWFLDEFRDQAWVDVFGYPAITDFTDDALKLAFAGPFSKAWTSQPERPLVVFMPPENGVGPQSKKRFTADEVREAAFWGLMLAPPAGISYAAEGVRDWNKTSGKGRAEGKEQNQDEMPAWKKSLFLPGAKQMARLVNLVHTEELWRLRPAPQFVAAQPGTASPRRYVTAASTESKDLSVVYVPEDRTVEISLEALPNSPNITWLNPRSGESSPAVAVLGSQSCQFPTPDVGDWLLVMKGGK
jgi:hypothetical protein